MIWYILLALLAIAIGIRSYSRAVARANASDSYWTPDASDYIFGTFMFGAVVTIFLGTGINAISWHFLKQPDITYNTLQNIGDSNGVEGHFSLFGGSIDNQPVYMYYLQDGSGQFRLYHVDADKAYITYTDETPEIVYHNEKSSNKWLSINMGDGTTYEFRVPRGSVKNSYTLDAQ